MLCPCCGNPNQDKFAGCACGARAIGEPQTDAIAPIPQWGPAMLGLALALVGLACYFSKFLVVVSAVSLYVSFIALRNTQRRPEQYGGKNMAWAGTVLSFTMLAMVLTLVGFEAPRWWRAHHEQELAASRARMLEVSLALELYKEKHGGLPAQIADLHREGFLSQPALDYWEGSLHYTPTGQFAAAGVGKGRSGVPVFTQYRLTSAGPDGVWGTRDDIVLSDNIFVAPEPSRMASDE